MRIFVSAETTSDARVARIIRLLRQEHDVEVDHSPLNPLDGRDGRWGNWYARGCREALEMADVFIAVETSGYGSSTWMAAEFEEAHRLFRERGRPKLFLSKVADVALPSGFRVHEKASALLPAEPDAAVAALLGGHGRADHWGASCASRSSGGRG